MKEIYKLLIEILKDSTIINYKVDSNDILSNDLMEIYLMKYHDVEFEISVDKQFSKKIVNVYLYHMNNRYNFDYTFSWFYSFLIRMHLRKYKNKMIKEKKEKSYETSIKQILKNIKKENK